MSHSEMIAATPASHGGYRHAHAPRRLSKRRVEGLLYDAVAEALGVHVAPTAQNAKAGRAAVAARTRQLETA